MYTQTDFPNQDLVFERFDFEIKQTYAPQRKKLYVQTHFILHTCTATPEINHSDETALIASWLLGLCRRKSNILWRSKCDGILRQAKYWQRHELPASHFGAISHARGNESHFGAISHARGNECHFGAISHARGNEGHFGAISHARGHERQCWPRTWMNLLQAIFTRVWARICQQHMYTKK